MKKRRKLPIFIVISLLGLISLAPSVLAFNLDEQKIIDNIIGGQKNLTNRIESQEEVGNENNIRIKELGSGKNVNDIAIKKMIEAVDIKNSAVDEAFNQVYLRKDVYNDLITGLERWVYAIGILVIIVAGGLGLYKRKEIIDMRKEFREETMGLFSDLKQKFNEEFGEDGKRQKEFNKKMDYFEETFDNKIIDIDGDIEAQTREVVAEKIDDIIESVLLMKGEGKSESVKIDVKKAQTSRRVVGSDPRKIK